MGFFRGGLLSLVSFLFFISLLLTGMTLTLSMSLNYENIQNEITPIVNGKLINQLPNETIDFMKIQCQNNSEFTYSQESFNLISTIPCEIINQGKKEIIEYSLKSNLEKIYYDEYDCGFWSCLTELNYPFVMLSQKAKDYWQGKFYLFLMASLILTVFIVLLSENKINSPITLGALILLVSFPIKKIESIIAIFTPEVITDFISIFVTKSNAVFTIYLILGIILVAAGLILRFTLFDKLKKKFSKSDVEEMVEKQVKKVTKSKKKAKDEVKLDNSKD